MCYRGRVPSVDQGSLGCALGDTTAVSFCQRSLRVERGANWSRDSDCLESVLSPLLLAIQFCTHYLITLSFHFPFVELAIEPAVSNVMKIKGNDRYNPLSAVRLVVNVQ